MWQTIDDSIIAASDFIGGYPLFAILIGGGLVLLVYSGFAPFRYLGRSVAALRMKDNGTAGQISSFEALMGAVAATIGMGNIAGVAIALSMGGPGAIFWLWVSAVVGMATKFFEGTLSQMYRGRDSRGELQGGPMYMIVEGLGRKWRPMAMFFSAMGLVGTLCLYQSNQLVESIDTVFFASQGESLSTVGRLCFGIGITAVVATVILGGIRRIARLATRMVPMMIAAYFLLVVYIVATHLSEVHDVFAAIFREAFSLRAGIGGLLGVALIGARRAASVNEAGVGTASMMHGASRTSEPVREGFVAMLGPLLDSGIVCTLTATAILLTGDYDVEGVKGLNIALNAFDAAMPGVGGYLLLAIVVVFAFSTMFSYSYYGTKCASFLFGAGSAKYYNLFFLAMLVVAAVIPLHTVVAVIDMSYALMALPTMFTLLRLAPKAKRALRDYIGRYDR